MKGLMKASFLKFQVDTIVMMKSNFLFILFLFFSFSFILFFIYFMFMFIIFIFLNKEYFQRIIISSDDNDLQCYFESIYLEGSNQK